MRREDRKDVDPDKLAKAVVFRNRRLCYTGHQIHKIPETLVKLYGQLTDFLDLSYNELVHLKGLEEFCFLRELILDNNQLNDRVIIPYLPYLNTLSINKNQIIDIEELIIKVKDNLPALTFLSLLGNKACPNELSGSEYDEHDYQRYRLFVIHHVPTLEFLDSRKVKNYERIEASRRGKFLRIARPKNISEQTTTTDTEGSYHNFTPLPRTVRNPNDHRGAYAQCRHRYSGKHSEGNRFIVNKDL